MNKHEKVSAIAIFFCVVKLELTQIRFSKIKISMNLHFLYVRHCLFFITCKFNTCRTIANIEDEKKSIEKFACKTYTNLYPKNQVIYIECK
jgi:hypothetical protein